MIPTITDFLASNACFLYLLRTPPEETTAALTRNTVSKLIPQSNQTLKRGQFRKGAFRN